MGHLHLVLRECAGLVGAYHRGGAHGLAGVHLAHEVVGAEHAAHRVGQREGHGHRQTFGDGHHYERDGYHQCLQQVCHEANEVESALHADEEHDDAAYDDGCGESVGYLGDEVAESVELLVERRLDAVVNLCGLEHLAVLGLVAHGEDLHHAVAFHNLGAAHGVVGGEGGVGVELRRVGALVAHRLAGEGRLVDVQRHGLEQLAVGRNFLAGVEDDDVAHDHVLARNLGDIAVADDLHRLVVVHLIEQGELAVGLKLEDECQTRGQEYGDEYSYGFEEYSSAFAESPVLVARDAYRQGACDEQDDDQRVFEFFEEAFP